MLCYGILLFHQNLKFCSKAFYVDGELFFGRFSNLYVFVCNTFFVNLRVFFVIRVIDEL